MDAHAAFADCPCCFESSGHPARIIPATYWEPSYAEPDYGRRCPECDGTGLVECETRTFDDLLEEAEEAGAALDAYLIQLASEPIITDPDLEAMVTAPAATVAGSTSLLDAMKRNA